MSLVWKIVWSLAAIALLAWGHFTWSRPSDQPDVPVLGREDTAPSAQPDVPVLARDDTAPSPQRAAAEPSTPSGQVRAAIAALPRRQQRRVGRLRPRPRAAVSHQPITSASSVSLSPVKPLPSPGHLPPSSAAAAPAAPADTSPTQQGAEPTLLEMRLGRLVTRTVQAFRKGDEALLPLSSFMQMAQLRAELSPTGRLQGSLEPGRLTFVVDAGRDAATIGRRTVPISTGLLLFHEGELYLAASRLGELLGIRFAVSWSDLEVVVADPSSLPVALQHRRRAARAALLRGRQEHQSALVVEGGRRAWDGFVLDYSWLMPGTEGLGGSSYAVAAGTSAAGGSLELRLQSVGRADSGQVRLDASWLGVWRQNRWLTQLRLGDGVTTGLGTQPLRGAAVTNAPFVRPSLLGNLYYSGRLPPGWEVEAYRGGELLWVDSTGASGRYRASLPVMYGENPVEFIAYGPTGEIRRFSRIHLVADELLPAGRLEYGVSAGDCRAVTCQAGANVDLRYGLSQRWALRAGVDRFWRGDSTPDLFHPYAGVAGSITGNTLVQVEAVKGAFIRGRFNYEPSLDLHLAADYTRFDTGTPAPILSSPDRRSQVNLSGFYRPLPNRDFLYVEGSLQRIVALSGTADAGRIDLSLQAGDVRVIPYARAERHTPAGSPSTARGFWGLNSFILPRPSWGSLFRQVWIRTGFESEELWRPRSASIQVARSLTPNVRLDLGLSWVRGARGPTFSLNLASHLRAVRSFTTVTTARGTDPSVTQLVQGSVIYNRASGGVSLASGPSLQRAGLAGRIFLDQNGNGQYDSGEEGLARVRVQVGSGAALSDSSGAYRIWDIVPFEPVLVQVDSLSFSSPLWLAPRPVVRLVPGPNQFTVYDVPIIVGAVLEGQVLGPQGKAVPGGISLVLRRRETGEERRITTFSDGAFYMLGLAPGEYELSGDPEQFARLGYRPLQQRIVVAPGETGEISTVVRLHSSSRD